MRVEFETPNARHGLASYWRGISFDRYDGTRWTKSTDGLWRPRRDEQNRAIVQPFAGSPDGLVKQSIYLEPMRTRMLFGLTRLHAVEVDRGVLTTRRRVQLDDDGDVHYTQTDDVAINYQAFSAAEPGARLDMAVADHRVRARRRMGRYLQLPAQLDPRIPALAREIVADANTVGQAVERLTRWLKANLSYTLDLKRDARFSPLADFLFVQRKGHCEYFATALVIMLRTQGIAARHVNGFLGGQWNEYGGYLAVSQGDAHSWVEVWAQGERWVTRDPTPSGGPRPAASGLMAKVRQYTDALRMRWYKYVIEYDLGSQVGIFQRIRGLWRSVFGSKSGRREGGAWRWWIPVALVGLLLGGVWLWRRRRVVPVATPRQLAAIARIYESLVRTYQKLGFLPPGHRGTAREALQRLREKGAPDVDEAAEIIGRYERIRFGGAQLAGGELSRLRRRVKRLGRAQS
jgi:transglutaminase-like putative cysteine protease